MDIDNDPLETLIMHECAVTGLPPEDIMKSLRNIMDRKLLTEADVREALHRVQHLADIIPNGAMG